MTAEIKPSTPQQYDALSLPGLLTIAELGSDELVALIASAERAKRTLKTTPGELSAALAGKSVTMLFEKPSLRTRMSFEIGLTKLGAHVIYFDHSKQRIGERESVKDYAKNLERWTDAVVARVFDHGVLEQFAQHASVPVVNALSDLEHPCQTLADLLTLKERFGSFEGLRVAWIGDGNNVCHSLMLACAKLGIGFTAVTPPGFEPKFEVVRAAATAAESSGAVITISNSPNKVAGHHAVYTDTWVSMGQEHHKPWTEQPFAGFQVDDELMALASEGLGQPSLFMHCLPAHRGEEVTDTVIDSPQSVVYDQAENRMHAQNALFLALFSDQQASSEQ
ncbi:MAG: ornithine carbamoyltransferase [Planctomycetota bacterium]